MLQATKMLIEYTEATENWKAKTALMEQAKADSSLDVVFTEDKSGKGFTGYIRGLPNVIAQGVTKGETISNLLCSLIDIYSFYLNGNE